MNPHAAALLHELATCTHGTAGPWPRLRELLAQHAGTAFGRRFGFDSIRSPDDFSAAIPPMNYEDYRSWIMRVADGEERVLACDRILGFERSSGTTSAPKWIPVTDGLRQEFARGLATWFSGWSRRIPAVFDGRAYWSLSPPGMAAETSAAGLPVGMTSDAAYFPPTIGERLAGWLVLPELQGGTEALFEETAAALLAAPDLSLVSVWSPTFLLGIDAALRRLKKNFTWRGSFPKLALASCWADASSAAWIPRLQRCLDGIPLEPKGLLATEGITSLPDPADGRPRLAAECHWHDFIDPSGAETDLADLRIGQVYEVLLTTAGGLFRYRSGDRVRVTSIGRDGLPRLLFIGRGGMVSDLVGEKLHEDQVTAALAGGGMLLADAARPGYVLWLEDPANAPAVEHDLRRNPYFEHALALGQLSPTAVKRLPRDWIVRACNGIARHRGCRIGDVKLPALICGIPPEEVESWWMD
jgi:hypothetical protein